MEILKLKISGKTAFFKKPDVNQNVFFTYGNIHKPVLLGIIGAVLGISGYSQQGDNRYPNYYEELKDLKLGIVPNIEGSFSRTIQTYNNSTGFWNKSACKKGGSNLIVKEQWIVDPSWDIYIDLNHIKGEEIKNIFLNKSFVFNPYLGNNSHLADIEEVQLLDGSETKYYFHIDSMFDESVANISEDYDGVMRYEDGESDCIIEKPFKYSENLPIGLIEESNYYIYQKLIYTNMFLDSNKAVIKVDNRYISFI